MRRALTNQVITVINVWIVVLEELTHTLDRAGQCVLDWDKKLHN